MSDEPGLSGVHTTALGAAAARTVHLFRDGEPKILRDEYAARLLGWSEEQILSLIPESFSTNTWVSRARFVEDEVDRAHSRGVNQYVILGAGLDSFALRRSEDLGGLVVYEVDDPPMQAWKRRRIGDLGLTRPSGLRFVPCDFEVDHLSKVLADAGCVTGEPIIASWLGVTQYLTRDAIDETLRWAAGLAQESEIVLTFVVPGSEAEAWKAFHATRGTRFETFFTPEEMAGALESVGLRAELVPPERVDTLYFEGRKDGMRASRSEWLIVGHAK